MWKRLDDSKLRNVGGDLAIIKRVYGWNGEPWPRLTISVYKDVHSPKADTYNLCVSGRDGTGRNQWWGDCGLPVELFGEAIEILAEAQEIISPCEDQPWNLRKYLTAIADWAKIRDGEQTSV